MAWGLSPSNFLPTVQGSLNARTTLESLRDNQIARDANAKKRKDMEEFQAMVAGVKDPIAELPAIAQFGARKGLITPDQYIDFTTAHQERLKKAELEKRRKELFSQTAAGLTPTVPVGQIPAGDIIPNYTGGLSPDLVPDVLANPTIPNPQYLAANQSALDRRKALEGAFELAPEQTLPIVLKQAIGTAATDKPKFIKGNDGITYQAVEDDTSPTGWKLIPMTAPNTAKPPPENWHLTMMHRYSSLKAKADKGGRSSLTPEEQNEYAMLEQQYDRNDPVEKMAYSLVQSEVAKGTTTLDNFDARYEELVGQLQGIKREGMVKQTLVPHDVESASGSVTTEFIPASTAAGGATFPKSPEKPLPETIREDVAGITNYIDLLTTMDKLGPETGGRVKGWITWGKNFLGIGSTDEAAIQAAGDQMRANVQLLIKGVPSQKDQEIFERTVPMQFDSDTMRDEKIRLQRKILSNMVRNIVGWYKGVGKQIPYELYASADKLGISVSDAPAYDPSKNDGYFLSPEVRKETEGLSGTDKKNWWE